jgi:ketosteroid isomerase-like protein
LGWHGVVVAGRTKRARVWQVFWPDSRAVRQKQVSWLLCLSLFATLLWSFAMHPNAQLIESFYRAFQKCDAETMAACYTDDIAFSDPVFPNLQGRDAGDMWRMLTSRAVNFSLVFDGVEANDQTGRAHWVATYTFSQTGNTVVNDISAQFEFRNGKIAKHTDDFDLWKWARQALGAKGMLLGWTPLVKNAIRQQGAKGLALFQKKSG